MGALAFYLHWQALQGSTQCPVALPKESQPVLQVLGLFKDHQELAPHFLEPKVLQLHELEH